MYGVMPYVSPRLNEHVSSKVHRFRFKVYTISFQLPYLSMLQTALEKQCQDYDSMTDMHILYYVIILYIVYYILYIILYIIYYILYIIYYILYIIYIIYYILYIIYYILYYILYIFVLPLLYTIHYITYYIFYIIYTILYMIIIILYLISVFHESRQRSIFARMHGTEELRSSRVDA